MTRQVKLKVILILFIFSIAFAFVESAVVFYLRTYLNSNFPPNPDYKFLLNLKLIAFLSPFSVILPNSQISQVETLREAATIVMLLAISFLAGKNYREKIGSFLISFSIWDIFYYIFLKAFTGWPKSLFDMDIYFLIPTPWIGPVITPIVISIIMLAVGLKLLNSKHQDDK